MQPDASELQIRDNPDGVERRAKYAVEHDYDDSIAVYQPREQGSASRASFERSDPGHPPSLYDNAVEHQPLRGGVGPYPALLPLEVLPPRVAVNRHVALRPVAVKKPRASEL